MTTKQPPAQKYLEMAQGIIREYCELDPNHDWNDVVMNKVFNANWLANLIAAALAETEREVYEHLDIPQIRNDSYRNGFEQGKAAALASKVVFPTDEEIKSEYFRFDKEHIKSGDGKGDALTWAYWKHLSEWLRSQLTLAPNEQVIRVPDDLIPAFENLKEYQKESTQVVRWYWHFDEVRGPFCRWFKITDVSPQYQKHVGSKLADSKFAAESMNFVTDLIKRLNPQARIEESNE